MFKLNGHAPAEIKLTPAGRFKAKDGRPQNLPGWLMTDRSAASVIAAASAQQDQLLIDYEHQTLYSRENGQPSPAAAWFKNLEWRPDDGLYATGVEWTAAAKASIEAKEYRYISPVLAYNKQTGEVTAVLMAALVNYPAIDGLTDLAAAHFSFASEHDPKNHPEPPTQEKPMNQALKALLGLADDATDEQINTAVAALQQQLDQVETLTDEVAALKANADTDTPDPAKYVPVETMTALQQQVAALSNQISSKECGELITEALSDGRLLEAQKSWAESLDVAALKAYLKDAPKIAALKSTQTGGKEPAERDENGLTADEVAICKATGIDLDDYKKTKGEH